MKTPIGELGLLFPSAAGFHDGTDSRRERFLGDEFAGIDHFPFASTEVSLLAVHPRLIDLAETLLDDQNLHRDYLNHTVLVPSSAPGCRQLEMFLYLPDVPEELGPPHLISRAHTADLPAVPNWYPRTDGADAESGYVSTTGAPELYAEEVSAAGPAGTIVAFELGTFHRGTDRDGPAIPDLDLTPWYILGL